MSQALTLGIHHMGLTVPDIEETADFFIQQLNFKKVGEKPDYPALFISDGTVMLTLWQIRDPEQCRAFDRLNNIGLHHVALRVSDTDALRELHAKLSSLNSVTEEFAPESLAGTAVEHMMCTVTGGIRVEFIAA